MSAISFKVLGGAKLAKKIDDFKKEALKAQRQTVKESILLIHENAVRSLQENTDGTEATRYDPYRKVKVSDPGDPPNTDTGRLARSIKFEIEGNGLIGRVGTNLKYGAFLEFGTQRMDARPWLQPAADAAAKEIGKIAKGAIEDVIGKAKK